MFLLCSVYACLFRALMGYLLPLFIDKTGIIAE